MRWFALPAKTLIGIDISARHIKLLVLSKSPHHDQPIDVQHFAVAELPMMILTESNDIKDHATISATLLQLKTSANLKCQTAAIALPGSAVVTQQIVLSQDLTDVQLEDQVWLEAAKHFPDLIEDLSLDFYNNGPAELDEHSWDILLVACRKASIEKRLAVLQDSHLQVQVVDVDYYALERSLRYMLQYHPLAHADDTVALLNFNSPTSTLIVLQNQRLSYAHDHSFDSQKLLQQCQQQLHWPNLLSQTEPLPTDLNDAAKQLLTDHFSGHIQHVLQLFQASNQSSSISHLFLAGDCALIPHIDRFVEQHTDFTVSIANPLIHMRTSEHLDKTTLLRYAPLLCLSSGLALHVLNP
jgi:type IV pilus assembly protein PilM